MTDQDLIALMKTKKEHRAFVKLYRYFRQVEKHIRANNGSKEDADDIFQDALIVLYNKVNETDFVLTSSLDTYLYSVCSLMWKDAQKKNQRTAAGSYAMESITDAQPITDAIEEDRKFARAENAFSQVTDVCRQLLAFFYVEKLSMHEIAARLNFSSEHSAKTQKYKCLEKARDVYSELSSNPTTL